jgi:hypothetical protein
MHYNTIRYHKRMNALRDMLGGKCVRCGKTHDLQFHHKDRSDKLFDMSRNFDINWDYLVEEAMKCELRCVDCHKEEHKATHGLGMHRHHGCRCDICRNAKNEYMRNWKKKNRERKRLLNIVGDVAHL